MSTQRFLLTGLLLLALLASGASASTAQPVAAQAAATPATSSGSMMIVENAGQWPDAARFQVWGSPLGAGTTWLAQDAIWLVVASDDQVIGNHPGGTRWQADPVTDPEPIILSPDHPATSSSQVALKLTFPGSNPDVRIEPFDPLTTTVSYFIGNDPAQWHPDVPVWGGVRYVDLYPGIDLELSAAGARLAARLGADLDAVTLQVEGAGAATLDGDTLRLSTAAVEVRLQLLRRDGLSAAHARARQRGLEVFEVSAPFAAQFPLSRAPTDDPADLLYSTFLGGIRSDYGHAVAVDETGRATVTGRTNSSDFPITPGAFDPTYNGFGGDAFVARLNAAGSALDYATFLGGSSNSDDGGTAVAVDEAGRATMTGYTYSSDFPTTPGAFDPTFNDYYDAFIARLNADGSALDYSTFLGGSVHDSGDAVAIDDTGDAIVTGFTNSSDFPTTPGVFDPSYNGGYWDAFVVRLNASGSALDYATFLGGSDYDGGRAVAIDDAGGATVTGVTYSSDFPTTPGAFDPSYNGGGYYGDVFVAKLNAAGSELDYATFLGGSDDEEGHAVAVDGTGRAIVTGYTYSSDFPTTPGAFDTSYNGGYDAFVARLNAAGSALDYATFLGGSSYDRGSAIAVDGTGRAIVTGGTGSSDFPTTPGAFDPSYNGDYTFDAFVARLNATGSMLDYATYLGGRNHDEGLAIAVDGAGRVTVTGRTNSGDFPITPGAFDPTFNGDDDAFVSKLDLEEPTVVTLAALQAGDAGAPSVSIWLLMALPAAALAVGAGLAQRQRCAPTGRRSTKAT